MISFNYNFHPTDHLFDSLEERIFIQIAAITWNYGRHFCVI
jgi:hypothetical protein